MIGRLTDRLRRTPRDPWEPAFSQHGGGRTVLEYTLDARRFFLEHRDKAEVFERADGSEYLAIVIDVDTREGPRTVGGLWSMEGRVIDFVDLRSHGIDEG